MSRIARSALVAALALTSFGTVAATGQAKMAEGVWTGTVFPPGDDMVDLEYHVAYGEEGLELTLEPPVELGVGTLVAGDVAFSGEVLSFTLQVGETVSCELYMQEDGHLEGECLGATGEAAIMTMFPPS